MLFEEELVGSHNIHLVILSVFVAIIASYAAITLVSRVKGNTRKDRWLLLCSSFLMGGGIWTMHYIGMLAFHLGIPVRYRLGLVIVSFVLPIISSMISFWLIVWHVHKKHSLFLSSVIMGLGVPGMHYTGMESMQMAVIITYEPILFTASIAIGIMASMLALRTLSKYRNGKITGKIGSSIFLGLAISSIHYMGISAATFTSTHYHHGVPSAIQFGGYSTFILASCLFIFLVLVVLFTTSFLDERYASKVSESEEQYRRLVELSPMGVAIHKFGVITYMNPVGMKILGAHTMEEVVGKHILKFIHPDYHEIVKFRWEKIREQNNVEPLEEKLIRLDNQIIDVEMTGIPITTNGETLVQIFFQDISDRKKAEKLVHHLAYHDALTKLPNRTLFLNRLNQTIQGIKSTHRTLAVMFIDLDGFKQVNDALGHDVGDSLLINVATRLSSCVSSEDMVSRLAGDEFVIMLTSTNENGVVAVAQRIIEVLAASVSINENEIFITPSIGITLSNDENDHAETLIKQADIAMYQAKKQGKNNFQIYV